LAVETHHFTTHELPPETVLYLTNQMYKKYPKAFVLGITGVAFELKIGLSAEAKKNLSQAVKGFCESIKVTNSLYT
jgi:Ni,Fe-hydrogenase maturation factor